MNTTIEDQEELLEALMWNQDDVVLQHRDGTPVMRRDFAVYEYGRRWQDTSKVRPTQGFERGVRAALKLYGVVVARPFMSRDGVLFKPEDNS